MGFPLPISRTPLHWAAVCEKPDMIRVLLAAGGIEFQILNNLLPTTIVCTCR